MWQGEKRQGYGVDFIYSQQLPKKSIRQNTLLYKKLYVKEGLQFIYNV